MMKSLSAASLGSGGQTVSGHLSRIFRVGLAGCYIGHGAFGIITKAGWLPYFRVAGIQPPLAWKLMPAIGVMDIGIGFVALLRPTRALLVWALVWTTWTALLRPLSGESFWEFMDRAGNYGVPLAWLCWLGWQPPWFRSFSNEEVFVPSGRTQRIATLLRVVTATFLIGHGACGLLLRKPALLLHYAYVFPNSASRLLPAIGAFELLLALGVLGLASPYLMLGVFVWKVASELLYPLSGAPLWEFIERFGSYAVPLAAALLLYASRPGHQSNDQPP